MGSVWQFLSDPSNQRTLGFLGSALVVLVGAAWALFVYFVPPRSVSAGEVSITADRFAELMLEAEQKGAERVRKELAEAGDNADLKKEIRQLQEKEETLLQALLANRDKTIAELKQTLADASAVLATGSSGLSRRQIVAANEEIKNGNARAAKGLLATAAAGASADAAEAEFLLGKLAESEADLGAAAGHFRRAVLLQPDKAAYRDTENRLYSVIIVYDSGLKDTAKTAADVLTEAGFSVETWSWLDYRESDDGPMQRWISRSTFLYGTQTDRTKVEEIERALARSGLALEADHFSGVLRKHGTEWSFGVLNVFLWLLAPE